VQSIRAAVEQTFGELKTAKVMERNNIFSADLLSKVLDCVIGLHNLRVLLRANANYEIMPRRHVIADSHIFRPLIPKKDVDLHIPEDKPDLKRPDLSTFRSSSNFFPVLQQRSKRPFRQVE
jgi:hypothetical protein